MQDEREMGRDGVGVARSRAGSFVKCREPEPGADSCEGESGRAGQVEAAIQGRRLPAPLEKLKELDKPRQYLNSELACLNWTRSACYEQHRVRRPDEGRQQVAAVAEVQGPGSAVVDVSIGTRVEELWKCRGEESMESQTAVFLTSHGPLKIPQ